MNPACKAQKYSSGTAGGTSTSNVARTSVNFCGTGMCHVRWNDEARLLDVGRPVVRVLAATLVHRSHHFTGGTL
jgi:hypothetical protein